MYEPYAIGGQSTGKSQVRRHMGISSELLLRYLPVQGGAVPPAAFTARARVYKDPEKQCLSVSDGMTLHTVRSMPLLEGESLTKYNSCGTDTRPNTEEKYS
jgi:hypothetical protein